MSKFCPACGEEQVDYAKFCKNCGKNLQTMEDNPHVRNTEQFKSESDENTHLFAIVIGYICSVLIPLFGLIFSIYLLTRNDSLKAKKHGKYMLIISVVVWALSFMSIFH